MELNFSSWNGWVFQFQGASRWQWSYGRWQQLDLDANVVTALKEGRYNF
jgi:hypothetical protein